MLRIFDPVKVLVKCSIFDALGINGSKPLNSVDFKYDTGIRVQRAETWFLTYLVFSNSSQHYGYKLCSLCSTLVSSKNFFNFFDKEIEQN